MREGIGRAPLRDALGKTIGIGGSQNSKEKDKLRIITCDKEITVVETRKIGELGINAHNNNSFNEVARRELGINSKDPRFEWNTEQTQPHILLGLKSGSLLSLPMKEEEMLKSELKVPVFSPELQIWRTPLRGKVWKVFPGE